MNLNNTIIELDIPILLARNVFDTIENVSAKINIPLGK